MAAQDVSAMPNPDRSNITEHPAGEENEVMVRVGKCHGYDGYIRVKKLASWGKKFGRPK